MNRDKAKKLFVVAANEISFEKNDAWFFFDLPTIGEDEEGNETYKLYISSEEVAEFSSSCTKKMKSIVEWLLNIPEINKRYSARDVLLFVLKASCRCINFNDSKKEEVFLEIRDSLKSESTPFLTIIPIKGLITNCITEVENSIIGMLSEEFENAIDSKCNRMGMGGFRFDDNVVWTEDYLAFQYMDDDERSEADIQDLPMLIAIWTHQHGGKSVEKVFTYVDLLSSTLVYLEHKKENMKCSSLNLLSINDYCAIYQDRDEDYGHDYFQFLVYSSTQRRKNEEFHKFNYSSVKIDNLVENELELLRRMFRTLEGVAHDWENRFSKFLHWYHLANNSENLSNTMICYSIALESLVGPRKAPDSVTNKIAERVAFLNLTLSTVDRLAVYKNIKKLYDKRSRLAHGQELFTFESDIDFIKEMRTLLLSISEKYIECAIQNNWEHADDMENWFDSIRFSIGEL